MKLLLMGAANPEAVRLVAAVQRVHASLEVLGFIDNDATKAGTSFFGFPVLGGSEAIGRHAASDVRLVNLITGSCEKRLSSTLDAIAHGAVLTNLIHPSTDLTLTDWGVGNYVQQGVSTQAGVVVGDNSSFSTGSVIGHETRIGNTVFLAPSVSVSGLCEIEDGCFLGTNSTVLPRLRIGAWSIVGSGAVVTKDVPPHSVVVGNPARFVRQHDVPFEDAKVTS